MRKKHGIALLLAAVIAASSAGCGSAEKVKDMLPSIPEASSSSVPDEEEGPDEEELEYMETEKFNAYVAVNNFIFDRLDLVINSYFKYVEPQEEFQTNDPDYWCNSLGSSYFEKIDLAHELSSGQPSLGALDDAYEAMYPSLKEMMTAFDAVYEYTDMKSYLDDDYAKGKELHATIWKAYNEYAASSDAFLNELDKLAAQKRRENLKYFQDEGLMAHYSLTSLIMTAQDIQDAIYAQGVDDANLIELDLEALQPLYDRFVSEVEECGKYLNDSEQMASEGWVKDPYFLKDALKECKLALTELFQRVKKQEPVSEFDLNFSFADDGTIRNFDDKLGELIDNYNSMNN